VNRSTFGAELNGLDDALESAKLAAMMYAEAHHGKKTTKEMKTMLENGTFPYRIEATIDAYSVFAALISKDQIRNPDEKSLKIILVKIREDFKLGIVHKLWWVNTLDMVADALTKGAVNRDAILQLMNKGHWTLKHPTKSHTFN
jgi:hypothetical protein